MKPVIGLTGCIGSGKSRVAEEFYRHGCFVIDADKDAREVLGRPSSITIIRRWWGDSVVNPDGTPNRKRIADIIFSDPAQKKRLEDLIYSILAVERELRITAAEKDSTVRAVVIDAPLLCEARVNEECEAVVVVKCSDEHRLARVQSRGWTAEELKRREDGQFSPAEKLIFADYVVFNDGPPEEIAPQVAAILTQIEDKRNKVLLNVEVNRTAIVDALTELGQDELFGVITDLDNMVADYNFTRRLRDHFVAAIKAEDEAAAKAGEKPD